MLRRLAVLAVLAPLALPAVSAAQLRGAFIPGEPIDGGAAIQSLGDLDIARDGTGAVTYVKQDGGVNHIFVSRLVNGVWAPPERVDAALPGVGSQPVVAAADGGKLVLAFVSGGQICSVVATDAATPWTAPQVIGPGSDPAIDQSINGVSYLSWTVTGDVVAARMERDSTAFAGLPAALDVYLPDASGIGTNRSKVAVAADGIATVVWGEGGHVFARRLYELRLSEYPQDLGGDADEPDISSEDDSSYAWVVMREGGRGVARRLVGSEFDQPVSVDGGEAIDVPRVAINGRGIGYAAMGGAGSQGAYGAVLKDDIFNAGVGLGGGGAVPAAVPTVAETGAGLIAFQQADGYGGQQVLARPYDYVAASRAVTLPGPPVLLSDPALGSTDAAKGMEASSDRAGDAVVAFVQGAGDLRRIVVASFDRAPGSFRPSSSTKWRNYLKTPLKWSESFELWGPVTYNVVVDGATVATTTNTFTTAQIPDGVHRWQVVAVDRRGQTTASASRNLRVDNTPPTAQVTISGTRKPGRPIKVTVKAGDASPAGAKASGLKGVTIGFGDGGKPVAGTKATHVYRRAGARTVTVTATDNAGNPGVVTRRVNIR